MCALNFRIFFFRDQGPDGKNAFKFLANLGIHLENKLWTAFFCLFWDRWEKLYSDYYHRLGTGCVRKIWRRVGSTRSSTSLRRMPHWRSRTRHYSPTSPGRPHTSSRWSWRPPACTTWRASCGRSTCCGNRCRRLSWKPLWSSSGVITDRRSSEWNWWFDGRGQYGRLIIYISPGIMSCFSLVNLSRTRVQCPPL